MKSRRVSWSIRIGIFFVVILLAVLGMWFWWKDGTSPVDVQDTTDIIFVVKRGETIPEIAGRLASERLIRSKTTFFLLVKLLKIDNAIQAGDFRLNRTMDAQEVAEELTHGSLDVWVTTLEGWRLEEIAAKMSKELGISEQEFIAAGEEGYMFPDTYLLPKNASAAAIVNVLRNTFDARVTDQMRSDAQAKGLSLKEVITLASIVEREGRSDEDRPVIAGILLKRLEAGWPLQTDATLQYALGYQAVEKTWWKQSLYNEDKKIDSRYNTYKHTGLPPGPISSPGLSSIRAVIYPVDSEYWFYLHDPHGGVHYAKTNEEHVANISKYLQ